MSDRSENVWIFDDRYITPGDNPTIGLILCSKKNDTIAKYSVLNNSKQLFASKYMLYLPTEEELKRLYSQMFDTILPCL